MSANHAFGCRIFRNVRVPMRDGLTLATSLYLPEGDGLFPTVLVRTAYNRVNCQGAGFAQRGFAYVSQDTRGRYASEGEWYPFINEEADGADTLEWLLAQPWCNGRIGMFGDSYLAATQFYAAISCRARGRLRPQACTPPPPGETPAPRGLVALNPRFMAGDCYKRAYYCDGAFSLGLTWSWLTFETSARTSEAALMPLFDVREILNSLPLLTLDEVSGAPPVQSYRDYVTNSQYGLQWEPLNVRARLHEVTVPTLLTGGWYDYYAGETFLNYEALQQGPAAGKHRVLLGPWTHGVNPTSVLGEVDFGPAALSENDATERWLECLLRDGAPEQVFPAPIRLFVMGRNEWRDEYEWPLARAKDTPYYLAAEGRLTDVPCADATTDDYVYDPADPVPTTGGNHSIGPYNPGLYEMAKPGPSDQQAVEARPDVLVYTSEPLDRDLEVTGPVVVHLYASTSAPDTDFVARLCDVYPDGRSINTTEGVLRARFHGGIHNPPRLLTPGQVYLFTIDLQATSNVFLAGHRLRVQITSSNFPLLDRNLNTGLDPATSTQMQVAEQTVYHGREHPSHIVLPVVP